VDKPLVSVVLPVYNRGRRVGEAIRSVLDQTFREFELIVVDDASTDETLQVVREIEDDRLRIIALEQQAGAPGARNAGLKEARGKWVAFQDSDDLWMPDKLAKQVARLEGNPQAVGCYTSYWRVGDGIREQLPRCEPGIDGDVLARLLRGNFITTQTFMVRRSLAIELEGFDTELSPLEDWEFAIRVAARGPISWVREPLVEYRLQADSITRNLAGFVSAYTAIVRKHHDVMLRSPADEAWHCAVIGNRLCKDGAAGLGRPYLWRSVKHQPLAWPYLAGWLCSWLPRGVFVALLSAYGHTRKLRK
jgi:glycosyltransferase involved in cell wall biosynthesis